MEMMTDHVTLKQKQLEAATKEPLRRQVAALSKRNKVLETKNAVNEGTIAQLKVQLGAARRQARTSTKSQHGIAQQLDDESFFRRFRMPPAMNIFGIAQFFLSPSGPRARITTPKEKDVKMALLAKDAPLEWNVKYP